MSPVGDHLATVQQVSVLSEREVLDLLVRPRRDTKAALKLMRKLLRKQGYAPEELVTDKLGSYGTA